MALGGHAFPWVASGDMSKGMYLRDWFAGQALAGIMSLMMTDGEGNLTPLVTFDFQHDMNAVAATAYRLADAMIAQRGNPLPPLEQKPAVTSAGN